MLGIIYKFTIVAKYKYDGHRPFYVGQHIGVDDFNTYWGSGRIWNDFLDKLKQDYPKHWKKLIRREILFQRECSQKVLDAMEMYYIKKGKAHYSYGLGGCNVLWGTANGFGSGSPAKQDIVRKKMSDAMQVRLSTGWKPKYCLTEEHFKRHSEFMKNYYKTHDSPTKGKKIPKEEHPMYGRKHSEESKRKMRDNHADFSGDKNPMFGDHRFSGKNNPFYGKQHSEDNKKRQSEIMKEYYKTHSNPWKGKHRVISNEQKKKLSISLSKTIWITNGVDNMRINKDLPIPNGWHRGRTGYKLKK